MILPRQTATLLAAFSLAAACSTACGSRDGASGAPATWGVPATSGSVPVPGPSAAAPNMPVSPSTATGTLAASGSPAAPAPTERVDTTEVAAEPERKTLKSAADDPAVYANRDFIADHYGVVRLPFPLQLQSVVEPHDRRAVLLTGEGPALEKPLIMMVEASGAKVWSRDKPLAGTRERARELTLTRGPRGEVLLFWYDEPTKLLAARVWTFDGGIFADFEVLSSEGCDAVTVLHWPGHGWVAALADSGALRAQLLGENGTLQWRSAGLEIPPPAAPGPRPPTQPITRPKIAVLDGDILEITLGPRKHRISRDGDLAK